MLSKNASKIYNIDYNFLRVQPQFIDTRLTNKFISGFFDTKLIANTISHLLIYQDFLTTEYETAIICDGVAEKQILPNILYITSNENISYQISKIQASQILSTMPLILTIDQILATKMSLCVKNLAQTPKTNDLWHKLFDK